MNFNRLFLSAGVLVSWTVTIAIAPLWANELKPNSASESVPLSPEAIESSPAANPSPPATPVIESPPAANPSPPATPVTEPPAVTKPAPAVPIKVMATHIVLDLTKRRVYAYKDQEVLASYPVAVGKKGWETPKGKFKVIQMVKNPVWKNPWNGKVAAPGPNSPLGERWIGFWTNGKDTIGFHGTPTIKSIGRAASHGCVRMFNNDVKALYEILTLGTPVTVK